MKLRVPHYYDVFHCITSECKDNCCVGGWQIGIDDETFDYYMKLEGELGEKIRASITKTDEYCFKLVDGHCPHLLESGLCRIHKELGAEHLSVVCDQFPRFSEYYGNVKESGIGLACEEAERIIFTDKHEFRLVEREIAEDYADEDFDYEFFEMLCSVRDFFFDIVNNKTCTVETALIRMLKCAADIQEDINGDDFDSLMNMVNELPEVFNDRLSDTAGKSCMTAQEFRDNMRAVLNSFEEMEILSKEWEEKFFDMINLMFEELSCDEYVQLVKEYNNHVKDREYEYKNYISYLVFRYFLKSVYDYDCLGKIRLAVVNYLVLMHMDMCFFYRNNKEFGFEDRIDSIHLFSRQVEYSEDNIELLYEAFIFDEVFREKLEDMLFWIAELKS